MTPNEAYHELLRHIRECGSLMPLDWVKKNGEGSKFFEAYEMALNALKEKEGKE